MKQVDIFTRLIERAENQIRLVGSTEYMEWLYEFTKTHTKFSDTDWMYETQPSLSEQDAKQVGLLTDFFTAIDYYHTRNLLNANTERYQVWYNIRYKDAYFAIGVCVGQGAYNFVTRYESYDKMLPESFIDFDYILQNKQAPGFIEKKKKLKQIQELAIQLKNLGTPSGAIEIIISEVFKNKQ